MDKKTILIVEDEAIAAIEMQQTLMKEGFHVPEIVTNGDDVLPAIMRTSPHLVIMDISLGSFIDGIDAARRVKILKETPIIYVTAFSDQTTKNRAMGTQPIDYLVKPICTEQLFNSIERALT